MIQQLSAVRIGGPLSLMLFSKQYLTLAERGLKEDPTGTAADVVLSVVYVQRHCLELIMKDLVLACFHISELQPLAGEPYAAVDPPGWGHEFERLVPNLKKALASVGYASAPEILPLATLAEQYVNLERGSRERFRYAHVDKFVNGKAPPHSFEHPVNIPVHDLQADLRQVYRDCADIDNEKSLYIQLYEESGALFQKAVELGNIDLTEIAE
jgi:hypothetical protein